MANERFKSKSGFILASIGASVGLGNALRFPGMCAKYGGGTYLFIYLLALLVLGVPLLNAEIALGRKHGGGAPNCLGTLKRGGDKVGWASCVNSVFTAIIYAGLAGWIIATVIKIVPLSFSASSLTQSEISGYFFETVLSAQADGALKSISPLVCGCILGAWILMYLCLKGGASSLSRAAKFTVVIPLALLSFMAVRGFTYGNAGAALSKLFLPDFSKLASPELWLSALGQVFFSLSVAVGIMPAYGEYLPDKTNVFSCSLIVAAADFFVSVLASVVLFTTLYGCGLEGEIGQSGIITAFAVYPVAITRLFGSNAVLNAVAGVLFYSSLAMMAVQSAVSMLEAFVSPFSRKFNVNKKKLARAICLIGAAISLIYATSAGVLIVDISDRFVNFYNVLLLCVSECIIIGWSKELQTLPDEINRYTGRMKMPQKLLRFSIKYLSPAVLLSLTLFEVIRLCVSGLSYPPWAQFAFGWGLSLLVLTVGVVAAHRSKHKSARV